MPSELWILEVMWLCSELCRLRPSPHSATFLDPLSAQGHTGWKSKADRPSEAAPASSLVSHFLGT